MKGALLLLTVLGYCLVAQAHRLDEYLQAARLGITSTRIELRLDLTPGVAIAEKLLDLIDPHRHDIIPRRELKTYSQRVLQDIHMELDGKPQHLKLVHATFPTRTEMEAGEGTIQLQATAALRKLKAGPHVLLFRNDHLPGMSVYLANALAPENTLIHITQQIRDERQQEYRLYFKVSTPPPPVEAHEG